MPPEEQPSLQQQWMDGVRDITPADGNVDPRVAFYEMGYAAAEAKTIGRTPVTNSARHVLLAFAAGVLAIASFTLGRSSDRGDRPIAKQEPPVQLDVPQESPTLGPIHQPVEIGPAPMFAASLLDGPHFELTASGLRWTQRARTVTTAADTDDAPRVLRAADVFQSDQPLLN